MQDGLCSVCVKICECDCVGEQSFPSRQKSVVQQNEPGMWCCECQASLYAKIATVCVCWKRGVGGGGGGGGLRKWSLESCSTEQTVSEP